MKILTIKYLLIIFAWMAGGPTEARAQDEVIKSAKNAISAGKSSDLGLYFNNFVELNLQNEKLSYSKAQAEYALQSFFVKYKVRKFEFIHQGESKEGMKYAIGTYTYDGGTFRVYMLVKQFDGKYLIDTLDFGEE